MNIIQNIIPKHQKKQRPGYNMKPRYITVHETANTSKGANAEMHSRYLLNGGGGRSVGWHFTVDDKEIHQHLPTDENGWHCTDGSTGAGNRQSIGIEICVNSDGDYQQAVENAKGLIRDLMKKHGISKSNVVPHKHWTGKNCPTNLLKRWDDFKDELFRPAKGDVQPKKQNEGAKWVGTNNKGKRVESIYKGSEGLNFYDSPRWDNPNGTFQYGQGWKIDNKYQVDDAYQYRVQNSKGDLYYITASDKYVKVIDEPTTDQSVKGRRAVAIVPKVNFYNSPRWKSPDGHFTKGQGWDVIEEIETNGSPQLKVKNSKGDVYYITARKDLIKII